MIGKTILQPIALPGELNPTSAETAMGQEQQVVETSASAAWKAFADGFVEGFAFPFSALFGMAGCSNNFSIPATDDGAPCDTSADAGVHPEIGSDAVVETTGAVDDAEITQDAAADIPEDAEMTDASTDASEDVTLPQDVTADAVTEDVAPEVADTEDVFQDVSADIPEDVALPQDATEDVAQDVDVYDSGICQYFCDAGITDTTDAQDATLPQDATPATDTSEPPVGVPSKMCSGPAGTEKLFAPPNSVAVACTNSAINALILGGNSCVAECGFYDNNVILSTAPNAPVPFSTALFAPPEVTKQSYTITLALHAPVFANSKTPALPGFMGSSFVFVYKAESFENTGYSQWDAKDVDAVGKLNGNIRITYKPYDYVYDTKEFLDITYSDISGKKVTYSYPCDQLSNPIVNCLEVK